MFVEKSADDGRLFLIRQICGWYIWMEYDRIKTNIYSEEKWCIELTKVEKIRKIQEILELKNPQENLYADLLKAMGDLKNNYGDYMITEPIDCDEELERISGADYELCTALLTMLLREDHFSNGSFERRFAEGQVLPVLVRMKDVLSTGV